MDSQIPGPFISVIVATFNAATTLQACLDSIVSQDLDEVEIIVIDGASTDGTVATLQARSDDLTHWASEPDRGVYDAWNTALDHAAGRWLIFLGADDVFAGPDVLSRVAPHLDAAEGRHKVVYGGVDVVAADGAVVLTAGEPWEVAGPAMRRWMSIPHQGTFHHRSLFEEHGHFDAGFRVAGDYEFLLRELLDHDALFVPDVTVVHMGVGGLSSSSENEAVILHEMSRARHMHALTRLPEWLSFHLWRIYVRDWIARHIGPEAARHAGNVYRVLARKPRL